MSKNYPLLEQIINDNLVIPVDRADLKLIVEVQSILQVKGLYGGRIDGLAGQLTKQALAEFKESIWLGFHNEIGKSTAASLLEIVQEHKITEQKAIDELLSTEKLGTLTGKTLKLPNGEIVYQNQCIVSGIPLLWGEVTDGCNPERTPESNQIVLNLIKTAHGFARIREEYGSPIGVNSGYRPPNVNRRVGGARLSQHVNGLALDLCPVDGNLNRLLEICRASDCVGLGRGMHRGFVHVDWRDGERVVFDYPKP